MGNTESYGYNPTTKSKLIDTQPQYQVYQSQSGSEYQKYTINYHGKQPIQQSYSFRINEKHDDFVELLYIGQAQGLIGCINKGKYEVITERIAYRFNSLSSISFRNSLTILKSSLRGFGDLYRKYGAFGIKDKMIGINRANKVKVWINPNFALNWPQELPLIFADLSPKDQQREMVQGIFDLINSKTETSKQWAQLMYLNQIKNPSSFEESLNFIQSFGKQNHLNINENISNIFQYKSSQNKVNTLPYEQSLHIFSRPNPEYQLNNKIVFHNGQLPAPIYQPQIVLGASQKIQILPKQSGPSFSYRFPIVQTYPANIQLDVVKTSLDRLQNSKKDQINLIKQPQKHQGFSNLQSIQLQKISQPLKPFKQQEKKQIYNQQQNYQYQINQINTLQQRVEAISLTPIKQNKQEQSLFKEKSLQYKKQDLLIQNFIQNIQNNIQNSHQSQISQQQSKQKDGQPCRIEQNNIVQTIKPSYAHKISLSNMQLQRPSLQNIKTQINVSLVDTRQIKKTSIQFQQENNNYGQTSNKKPLSYREMRRLLLQQLQN